MVGMSRRRWMSLASVAAFALSTTVARVWTRAAEPADGKPAAAKAAAAKPAAATKPAAKPKLPPAPAGVVIEQDVAYLPPGRAEKLDLYLPADRAKDVRSPAVLIIHGGGWTGGDKAAGREFNIGTTLATAGYVCASVNYQMEAGKRWPTNLQDCKNAVRFLRANADKYGVDVKRVGVIGGSAGGHLALMVGYTTGVAGTDPGEEPGGGPYPGVSDAVSAVVDLYGISDVRTRRKTDPDGTPVGDPATTTSLFDGSVTEKPELWKLASPVSHIKPSSPPTLILHGTRDTTVDRDQATQLEAALKAQGVPHQLVMVEGAGHTFDLQTWNRKPLSQDLRPLVVGFFDEYVKGK
jgi:acetyl esterase/lipase